MLNLAKVGPLIPPARKALRFSQHSSTLRDDSCLKLLGFGALAMIRYYEMSCPLVVGGFMTSLMPGDEFLEVHGIRKQSFCKQD